MKKASLGSLGILITATTTSIAAPLFPTGLVSDWNAMHSQGNQVTDSVGINMGVLNNVSTLWDGNGDVFTFNTAGNNITITENPSLDPTNEFSISTWIRVNNFNSIGNQTLLSKIQRSLIMSPSDLSSFDATDANGIGLARGFFQKTVFDGRYVYSVSIPPAGGTSNLVRYDTQAAFTDASAWSSFNMKKLAKSNDIHWYSGYNSLVFDGRYIYLVPTYFAYEPGVNHGFTLRYDTKGPIDDPTSWKSFDIRPLDGNYDLVRFKEGAFDGKYIYFTGGGSRQTLGQKVARYDTSLNFDDAASWTYQSISTLLPNVGTTLYNATFYAGNYLYFLPSTGLFVRYDVRKAFNDPSSWSTYDASITQGIASVNYTNGTSDGRYVYFSPGVNYTESMLRYDSTMNFNDPTAWTTHSVKEPIATGKFRMKSYGGAGFDGQYVYYFPNTYKQYNIPNIYTRYGGRVLRYDTKQDYSLASAWSELDFSTTAGSYLGAAFDQRYFYIATAGGSSYRATFSRLDTASAGNYAFSMNRTVFGSDSNSPTVPGLHFNIGTSMGYFSLYTTNLLNTGWHLITGTYDGSGMSLYIDNALVANRTATGMLNSSSADLLIGSSINNSFSYLGDMNKIEFYNRALNPTDIAQVYRLSPYGGCNMKLNATCTK